MLPEGGEVMRRVACADVCPAPPPDPAPVSGPTLAPPRRSPTPEKKELLRQQLLSTASKEPSQATSPCKTRPARGRQKNRWKLKFHHQALPQEYLDHYEQSLQKARADEAKGSSPCAGRSRAPRQQQRAAPATTMNAAPPADVAADAGDTLRLWAARLGALPAPAATPAPAHDKKPAIAPTRIMTYADLPYMGEMTLNNSKPRRGRKPKKADICHLIYENYGTVVSGQPGQEGRPPPHRTDLQNKIISSLLEKKLVQESRRRQDAPPASAPAPGPPGEPLNLCMRDLRRLQLEVRHLPTPPAPERDAPHTSTSPDQPNVICGEGEGAAAWPGAPLYMQGLALHTQLLYYHKLASAAHAHQHAHAHALDENDNRLGSPSPPPAASVLTSASTASTPATTPVPAPAPRPPKRKRSAIFIPPVRPGGGGTGAGASAGAGEVSICKFKFTGGSRPTLQEKKMVSVDAGGTLRYYSGPSARARAAPAPSPAPTPAAASTPAVAQQAGAVTGAGVSGRRGRKSLQRERLEQRFREKGFLIQTQQLQSAEGATYCKFRQLRKFTRYLFRSWRAHLPPELACAAEPAAPAAPP